MQQNTHGWSWLRDLRVDDVHVGVHAHEHGVPQPVLINVGMWVDTARAARSDDLRDAVDWAAVASAIERTARSRHFRLIETMCEAVASCLLGDFDVGRVQVEVKKPESLPIGMASIAIERTRKA